MGLSALPRTVTREQYLALRAQLRSKGYWEDFRPCVTALDERAQLAERVKEHTIPGTRRVYLYQWSRDCDMCESSSIREVAASVMTLVRREQLEHEWAEGPWVIRTISPADAAEFTPSFRDRVAEAWDNGNVAPFIV